MNPGGLRAFSLPASLFLGRWSRPTPASRLARSENSRQPSVGLFQTASQRTIAPNLRLCRDHSHDPAKARFGRKVCKPRQCQNRVIRACQLFRNSPFILTMTTSIAAQTTENHLRLNCFLVKVTARSSGSSSWTDHETRMDGIAKCAG